MAYVVSHKYTIVAGQIKSLQFYYCVHLMPPSWTLSFGLHGLLQLSKREIPLEEMLQIQIPTGNSEIRIFNFSRHAPSDRWSLCICRFELEIFTLVVSDRRCHFYVRGRLLINIAVNCLSSLVFLSQCFGYHVDDDSTAQSHCTAI